MPDTRYQIFFDERISDISYLITPSDQTTMYKTVALSLPKCYNVGYYG